MKAKSCRIKTGTGGGVAHWRELHKVGRNDHGDILLTLDGGEVWQFTPNDEGLTTPRLDEVDSIAVRQGSVKWLPILDVLWLKNPERVYGGTIRIFKPHDDVEKAAERGGLRGGKAGVHEAYRERDKKQRKAKHRIREGQYDAENWTEAWKEVRRRIKAPGARIGEVLAAVHKSKCRTKVSFERFRRKWYLDEEQARKKGSVK